MRGMNKWSDLIIHSCLALYISLQIGHLTLEHLSVHLKPRGIHRSSVAASVSASGNRNGSGENQVAHCDSLKTLPVSQ